MPRPTLPIGEPIGDSPFISWARYVFWADLEYERFVLFAESDELRSTMKSVALVSKWYAALQVAVEGWLECQFDDPLLDELLLDPALTPYRDRLRRFRNVIYHYQPAVIMDRRATDFLQDSEATFPWAHLVHEEFKRVVWDVTHPAGLL